MKKNVREQITQHSSPDMRPHSSILVDGPERAAARAMLYPVGFKEEDFKKPIIGIASITPLEFTL